MLEYTILRVVACPSTSCPGTYHTRADETSTQCHTTAAPHAIFINLSTHSLTLVKTKYHHHCEFL